jgi:hypothetical protein
MLNSIIGEETFAPNQDKATARPWQAVGRVVVNENRQVADCRRPSNLPDNGEDAANAALIVEAVNEHGALVAVAEAANKYAGQVEAMMLYSVSPGVKPERIKIELDSATATMRAALAAIRGGGQ